MPPSWSFTSIALRAREGAPAVDLGDLVLLHQEVDALDDAGAHLARPRVGGAEGHRGVALDAVLVLLVRQHVRELGVPEQRLGRDAADVEADAAPVLVLDDRHGLAELGRADRRDVATGAGSEHQHVEVSHAAHPIARLPARGGRSAGISLAPRDAVRRLRVQPGPRPDGRALPALAAAHHRLADRLAAHLRRRGPRLGRRPVDHRRGPDRPGLRGGLRRHPRGRGLASTTGSRPAPASTARPRSGSRR